uniref:Transmembrane protein n=1 Tax=Chromera velia CCMP2878 TaxID=1169474 RepID=A0A0G4F3R3_9ALVE|eukprot:Cvel_14975.t1-p1 / transcript=Cvel_14975.t1 / gene=Cvel_14975 / organism=Chromera_velia_CCMP2878 / gene_product=hypothetical protein / transcript_product=hypothetical protein / location=Cvel_scaffold1088:26010-35267(+) / protein_length=1518 / sequence_SO=supercontig / SO=protein_coding / is_pseudo=false
MSTLSFISESLRQISLEEVLVLLDDGWYLLWNPWYAWILFCAFVQKQLWSLWVCAHLSLAHLVAPLPTNRRLGTVRLDLQSFSEGTRTPKGSALFVRVSVNEQVVYISGLFEASSRSSRREIERESQTDWRGGHAEAHRGPSSPPSFSSGESGPPHTFAFGWHRRGRPGEATLLLPVHNPFDEYKIEVCIHRYIWPLALPPFVAFLLPPSLAASCSARVVVSERLRKETATFFFDQEAPLAPPPARERALALPPCWRGRDNKEREKERERRRDKERDKQDQGGQRERSREKSNEPKGEAGAGKKPPTPSASVSRIPGQALPLSPGNSGGIGLSEEEKSGDKTQTGPKGVGGKEGTAIVTSLSPRGSGDSAMHRVPPQTSSEDPASLTRTPGSLRSPASPAQQHPSSSSASSGGVGGEGRGGSGVAPRAHLRLCASVAIWKGDASAEFIRLVKRAEAEEEEAERRRAAGPVAWCFDTLEEAADGLSQFDADWVGLGIGSLAGRVVASLRWPCEMVEGLGGPLIVAGLGRLPAETAAVIENIGALCRRSALLWLWTGGLYLRLALFTLEPSALYTCRLLCRLASRLQTARWREGFLSHSLASPSEQEAGGGGGGRIVSRRGGWGRRRESRGLAAAGGGGGDTGRTVEQLNHRQKRNPQLSLVMAQPGGGRNRSPQRDQPHTPAPSVLRTGLENGGADSQQMVSPPVPGSTQGAGRGEGSGMGVNIISGGQRPRNPSLVFSVVAVNALAPRPLSRLFYIKVQSESDFQRAQRRQRRERQRGRDRIRRFRRMGAQTHSLEENVYRSPLFIEGSGFPDQQPAQQGGGQSGGGDNQPAGRRGPVAAAERGLTSELRLRLPPASSPVWSMQPRQRQYQSEEKERQRDEARFLSKRGVAATTRKDRERDRSSRRRQCTREGRERLAPLEKCPDCDQRHPVGGVAEDGDVDADADDTTETDESFSFSGRRRQRTSRYVEEEEEEEEEDEEDLCCVRFEIRTRYLLTGCDRLVARAVVDVRSLPLPLLLQGQGGGGGESQAEGPSPKVTVTLPLEDLFPAVFTAEEPSFVLCCSLEGQALQGSLSNVSPSDTKAETNKSPLPFRLFSRSVRPPPPIQTRLLALPPGVRSPNRDLRTPTDSDVSFSRFASQPAGGEGDPLSPLGIQTQTLAAGGVSGSLPGSAISIHHTAEKERKSALRERREKRRREREAAIEKRRALLGCQRALESVTTGSVRDWLLTQGILVSSTLLLLLPSPFLLSLLVYVWVDVLLCVGCFLTLNRPSLWESRVGRALLGKVEAVRKWWKREEGEGGAFRQVAPPQPQVLASAPLFLRGVLAGEGREGGTGGRNCSRDLGDSENFMRGWNWSSVGLGGLGGSSRSKDGDRLSRREREREKAAEAAQERLIAVALPLFGSVGKVAAAGILGVPSLVPTPILKRAEKHPHSALCVLHAGAFVLLPPFLVFFVRSLCLLSSVAAWQGGYALSGLWLWWLVVHFREERERGDSREGKSFGEGGRETKRWSSSSCSAHT